MGSGLAPGGPFSFPQRLVSELMKPLCPIAFDSLRELATRYGIQTSHKDMFGNRTVATAETLLETLRALGVPILRMQDVPGALREHELRSWRSGLEPVTVAWNGRLREIPIRLEAAKASGRARCRILFEDGLLQEWESNIEQLATHESIEIGGQRHLCKRLPLPGRLPAGYHHIQVECRGGGFDSLVIASPPRAYDTPGKSWGVFLPLYALQSQWSWGAGDLTDLQRLGNWVTEQGGTVISTLPLLAAYLDQPFEISPYMPASRLFWNELYVDPRRAPEFVACRAALQLAHSHSWQEEMEALRALERVDHRRLMALKRPLLEAMAQTLAGSQSDRATAFREYVNRHPQLRDYARFRAATEKQRLPWPKWPHRLRNGRLQAGEYDPHDELYHQYVQWIAEEQLGALAAKTGDRRAGLYLDFPLGVHPYSYDVWREREIFALGVSTGAPPDTLFIKGQNWNFPPLDPQAIRRTGYSYVIACLRQQFRHTSWVRMDHVMGLHRLFWIPGGCEAADGVYVSYRAEELYAILCLESHRLKTVVVGENLGTVPAAVNREMRRRGLKPMYVLQYEVQPEAEQCLRPVPANAIASLNSHDMPPFAAFWKGSDLSDLKKLGLFSAKEFREQSGRRQKLRQALGRFLADGKSTQPGSAALSRVFEKSLEWLAGSKAKMVVVNLEDLWLETAPQNVPGTHLERPNWQRKALYPLEQITSSGRFLKLLRTVARLRTIPSKPGRRGAPQGWRARINIASNGQ